MSPSSSREPSPAKDAQTSPALPAALPSFPLPIRPDAPSKATLALQGLDKALVEAELVDPSKLYPLKESGDDTFSGLSEKTVKRLKELGITELFAGMFRLLNLTTYY